VEEALSSFCPHLVVFLQVEELSSSRLNLTANTADPTSLMKTLLVNPLESCGGGTEQLLSSFGCLPAGGGAEQFTIEAHG
jgi:hypothetical protein